MSAMVRASIRSFFFACCYRPHHGRMRHVQLRRVGLQCVVDPTTEQSGFHGAAPWHAALAHPLPQHRPGCDERPFLDDAALGRFHAEADGLFVNVESDIVNSVHGVLLIAVSEPAQ
jgi:hypothetical protein